MHHVELKISTYNMWITNKIEPNLVNLNWAIRVLHELNIRTKFKATHGNLMKNLLDLAKSNRADNQLQARS
jgi:hypothetical protein